MNRSFRVSLSLSGFMTLLLQASGQVLTFGAHALFARSSGTSDYGVFSIASALAMTVLILARFGQDMVVLRGIAALEAASRWGEIAAQWRASNRVVLVVGTLTVVAAFLLTQMFDLVPPTVTGVPLALALLAVPMLAFSSLRFSALLALRRPYLAQIAETVVRPSLMLVAALVALLAGIRLSAQDMLVLALLSALAALLTGELFCRRSFVQPAPLDKKRALVGTSLVVPGVWMLIGVGAYQAITQIDILAVGAFRGEAVAGTYAAASKVSLVTQYGLLALQMLVTPAIAAAYAGANKAKLQEVLAQVARLSTLFAAAAAVVAWLFAEQILSLFGARFVAGADVLRILVAAHLVNAATGVTGGLLMMTGRHRAAAAITVGHLVLQIGLLLVLVPRAGAVGAAVATTVATSACHLVMSATAWRTLRVRTWVRFAR